MSIIALSLEIRGDTPDERRVWQNISERLGIAANEYLARWQAWHLENGSREKLADWLASLRDWHRSDHATRGNKPKCPVTYDTPALAKELRDTINAHHEQTNVNTLGPMLKWLRETLCTKPGSGGLSEWIEILLHRRGGKSFTRGIPIPVIPKLYRLFVREDGELAVEFRCDRIPRDGQRATSTLFSVHLRARGKRERYARPAWDAAKSGAKLRQAKLVYRQSSRKWFFVMLVEAPEVERKPLDKDRVAVVCPGWTRPFLIRVTGGSGALRHGFRAEHIGHLRSKIMRQRISRQNHYRLGASQQRKSHGRKRAILAWEGRLSRQWQAIQKLNSDQWSFDLAERLVKMQVGRVILIQPTDGRRFLETTGVPAGYEQASGWDWTQWIAMSSRKLSREGIEVQVVKDSAERNKSKRYRQHEVA